MDGRTDLREKLDQRSRPVLATILSALVERQAGSQRCFVAGADGFALL